jgi:hypothetical protein
MAILNQYFCSVPNCRYHFKDGTSAVFIGGVFKTSKAKEIAEMDAEVEAGHDLIYTKPEALTYDSIHDDPLAGLKTRLRKEIEAELVKNMQQQAAALNKDFGDTNKSEGVKAASTVDMVATSGVSNSPAEIAANVKAAVASVSKK